VRRKGKKKKYQLNERKILLIYTHICQHRRLSQLVRNTAQLGHLHSIWQLNQSFQTGVALPRRLRLESVTNTGLLGLGHVLAVRPWHTGCLFVSSHAVFLLPSLHLLFWFNDTSMIRSRLAPWHYNKSHHLLLHLIEQVYQLESNRTTPRAHC
jgi:hypothetical protein